MIHKNIETPTAMKFENIQKRSEVEYLSRDQISRRAMDMVQAVFKSAPSSLRPQPVERLIGIFQEKGWLKFSHDEDLGELPGSRKILGEFSVEPFRIKIDRSLSAGSPRFMFTLAHEIGHFCLHRRMIGVGKFISREQLPRDAEDHLRYREMAALSDLGWAEWQANEFAMALILPQLSLRHRAKIK